MAGTIYETALCFFRGATEAHSFEEVPVHRKFFLEVGHCYVAVFAMWGCMR